MNEITRGCLVTIRGDVSGVWRVNEIDAERDLVFVQRIGSWELREVSLDQVKKLNESLDSFIL